MIEMLVKRRTPENFVLWCFVLQTVVCAIFSLVCFHDIRSFNGNVIVYADSAEDAAVAHVFILAKASQCNVFGFALFRQFPHSFVKVPVVFRVCVPQELRNITIAEYASCPFSVFRPFSVLKEQIGTG